jgi:drug/metabolite transporter (DMT)-like permease
MVAAVLTTFLFAISASCAARTAHAFGPFTANLLRLLLATMLLGIWAHVWGAGVGGDSFWWFFASGLVGFGIGDLGLFLSLPRLGSRLALIMVQCLAAPIATASEWIWLGTRLQPVEMLSAAIILLGVTIALLPSGMSSTSIGLSGIVFGVIAAAGQAYGAVLSRKGYNVAALEGNVIDGGTAAYQRILAGVAIAGISVCLARCFPALCRLNQPTRAGHSRPWGAVVLNALSGPVLGVACYQWALATAPSGIVLPIVATAPLAVMPLAYYLEQERPSARSILGGILAVLGAVVLGYAQAGNPS